MYKNFFGLRENPFNVNPDPRFLYLTSQAQRALDELTYGIQNRKGLILLTGEVGTGKTTLINCLLDWLRHRKIPTAFIFNSRLSVDHLFEFILTDFDIPIDMWLKSNMLLRLNTWLIECFRSGEKSWSSHLVTGLLRTVSLAEWSHVCPLALRRIRQSASLGQALLQRWKCDFKRDWIAMINAMYCRR